MMMADMGYGLIMMIASVVVIKKGTDDLKRASEDTDFRNELFKEYGIL